MSNRCLQLFYQLEEIQWSFEVGSARLGEFWKACVLYLWDSAVSHFPLSYGEIYTICLVVSHPASCLVFQLRHIHILQGKSTVLQMIAGKLKPTSGHVFIPPHLQVLQAPGQRQKSMKGRDPGELHRFAARWRTHPASFQKASRGISFLEFLMMICPWYLGKHLMKHCTNSSNSCEPCQIFRRIRAASRWIQPAKNRCLFWSVLNSFWSNSSLCSHSGNERVSHTDEEWSETRCRFYVTRWRVECVSTLKLIRQQQRKERD